MGTIILYLCFVIVTGVMFGYSATGIRVRQIAPQRAIRIETTQAARG